MKTISTRMGIEKLTEAMEGYIGEPVIVSWLHHHRTVGCFQEICDGRLVLTNGLAIDLTGEREIVIERANFTDDADEILREEGHDLACFLEQDPALGAAFLAGYEAGTQGRYSEEDLSAWRGYCAPLSFCWEGII